MTVTGQKIKELRTLKKITQEELASLLGVSRNTIVGYEQGKVIPDSKQLLLQSVLQNNSKPETSTSTPYYPDVNASAGLNFLSDPSKNYSVPISIPNVRADAFINVFGDSMYPKYCSGEIIGIKEIEKEMVMFGHAYVIQLSDGEAYLKYIKKGADDEHWLLASENQHYEPREFHLKYIEKVFIIKAIISKTTLL